VFTISMDGVGLTGEPQVVPSLGGALDCHALGG